MPTLYPTETIAEVAERLVGQAQAQPGQVFPVSTSLTPEFHWYIQCALYEPDDVAAVNAAVYDDLKAEIGRFLKKHNYEGFYTGFTLDLLRFPDKKGYLLTLFQ